MAANDSRQRVSKPTIAPIRAGENVICEQILRQLPTWFGIEDALAQYVQDTTRLETWLAWHGTDPLGFVTLHNHFPRASEIHCIAVSPTHHRQGIGRALINFAECKLRRDGVEYLQVKTLGPSRKDASYSQTRAFYESVGFTPLEESSKLWGPENPCLIMVKRL